MMGFGRRKCGRFGISRIVASLAAITVLVVSPAIVSVADARLDGVRLDIAESVLGQSLSAQLVDPCVLEAREEFEECLHTIRWYLRGLCKLKLVADMLVCLATD